MQSYARKQIVCSSTARKGVVFDTGQIECEYRGRAVHIGCARPHSKHKEGDGMDEVGIAVLGTFLGTMLNCISGVIGFMFCWLLFTRKDSDDDD